MDSILTCYWTICWIIEANLLNSVSFMFFIHDIVNFYPFIITIRVAWRKIGRRHDTVIGWFSVQSVEDRRSEYSVTSSDKKRWNDFKECQCSSNIAWMKIPWKGSQHCTRAFTWRRKGVWREWYREGGRETRCRWCVHAKKAFSELVKVQGDPFVPEMYKSRANNIKKCIQNICFLMRYVSIVYK